MIREFFIYRQDRNVLFCRVGTFRTAVTVFQKDRGIPVFDRGGQQHEKCKCPRKIIMLERQWQKNHSQKHTPIEDRKHHHVFARLTFLPFRDDFPRQLAEQGTIGIQRPMEIDHSKTGKQGIHSQNSGNNVIQRSGTLTPINGIRGKCKQPGVENTVDEHTSPVPDD